MSIKSVFPKVVNGVHYATPPKVDFEATYLDLRAKENRVPGDDLVRMLPHVPKDHPHANEWRLRRITLQRFLHYLGEKRFHSILDIGCGNGWFTAQLRPFADEVTGLDVGKEELEAAARCFGGEKTTFLCCSDWSVIPSVHFDCITFNASVQYFEFNAAFWENLYRMLKPGGEIHFLDSPFYPKSEVESAKKRSEDYFKRQGSESAGNFYFHHAWEELPAGSETRYQPKSWKKWLRMPQSPFPWIVIRP